MDGRNVMAGVSGQKTEQQVITSGGLCLGPARSVPIRPLRLQDLGRIRLLFVCAVADWPALRRVPRVRLAVVVCKVSLQF